MVALAALRPAHSRIYLFFTIHFLQLLTECHFGAIHAIIEAIQYHFAVSLKVYIFRPHSSDHIKNDRLPEQFVCDRFGDLCVCVHTFW